MENYLLTIYDETEYNAGPKAKRDAAEILTKSKNFKKIDFYFDLNNSIISKLKKLKYLNMDIPKGLKDVKSGNLFIQYPIYSSVISQKITNVIPKNVKVYYLIHDLESLRLFKDSEGFKQEEIQRLNEANGIISHNPKMTKWLKENGVTTKIVDLEIFDYLSENMAPNNKYDKSVCYAGNLAKSEFLKVIPRKLKLGVYGPNPAQDFPENIEYKGVYKPDELPKYLVENFGLVWDGKQSDKCDGIYGEYMKYNNPHKVSLYLSSGMPVIIWKKAALADFIEKNNVGLVIESLDQINEKLNSISESEFLELKQNTVDLSQKLKSGFYLNRAVDELLRGEKYV